jgi:membrane-associated PAP2 superfamily phosphatase
MAHRSLPNAFGHVSQGGGVPVMASQRSWLVHHLLWPGLAFAVAIAWLGPLHGDLWIADRVYAGEGHAWSLKDHFMTEQLIHIGGKRLSAVAWLGVLLAWAASLRVPALRQWRRPLLYLWMSVLLATTLVGAIKRGSGVDCPWDLLRYGGDRPYFGWYSLRPAGMADASCFPAGHASAGYAWVALYFFLSVRRAAWRVRGLAIGLIAGAVFGIAQQLRGAHFLSHDLSTLMICWSSALLLYVGMLASRGAAVAGTADAVLGASTASTPDTAMAGVAR